MNTGVKILIGAFLFWIAENWYFGGNITPSSPAEACCDNIVVFMVILALLWGKNKH